MREVEFLPAWYPTLRRKRRFLVIEGWLGGVIVSILSFWIAFSARNVLAQQSLLAKSQNQLEQSNAQLRHVAELQALKEQMLRQVRTLTRFGPDVPMDRLVSTLEDLLPKEMALKGISVRYADAGQSAVAPERSEGNGEYTITVRGVAPSDVELGEYLARLTQTIPGWIGGPMTEDDLHENGHLLREFCFSFGIQDRPTGVQGK